MRNLARNTWRSLLLLVICVGATPVGAYAMTTMLACLPPGEDMIPQGDIDSMAELPGGG
jgi:hypothetical protein